MISGKLKWILITVVGLLLLIVVWLKPWSAGADGFEALLLKDDAHIDQIEITREFDTLRFVKKQETWEMDDEVLNQKAVENLLIAAAGMSKKSIIPKHELAGMKMLSSFHFKEGRKSKAHFEFVSGSPGYFILNETDDMAYGIEIAGHENFPLERIFSSNPNHYREHLMIDLLPDEVRKVRIQPISGRAFEASQDSAKEIKVLSLPDGEDITMQVDEQKIRLLFSFFNGIRYEELISQSDIAGGALSEERLSVIEVADFYNNHWKMEIFPWVKTGSNETDLFHSLVRFSGMTGTLSVNYFYLDLLMRGLENYMQE